MNSFPFTPRIAQIILPALLILGGVDASAQKDPLLSFSLKG